MREGGIGAGLMSAEAYLLRNKASRFLDRSSASSFSTPGMYLAEIAN